MFYNIWKFDHGHFRSVSDAHIATADVSDWYKALRYDDLVNQIKSIE